MYPKDSRKIFHPESTDIFEFQVRKSELFVFIVKAFKEILKKIRKISHSELEIYLYQPNFRKEVSQLTDLQTYKNLEKI